MVTNYVEKTRGYGDNPNNPLAAASFIAGIHNYPTLTYVAVFELQGAKLQVLSFLEHIARRSGWTLELGMFFAAPRIALASARSSLSIATVRMYHRICTMDPR